MCGPDEPTDFLSAAHRYGLSRIDNLPAPAQTEILRLLGDAPRDQCSYRPSGGTGDGARCSGAVAGQGLRSAKAAIERLRLQ